MLILYKNTDDCIPLKKSLNERVGSFLVGRVKLFLERGDKTHSKKGVRNEDGCARVTGPTHGSARGPIQIIRNSYCFKVKKKVVNCFMYP